MSTLAETTQLFITTVQRAVLCLLIICMDYVLIHLTNYYFITKLPQLSFWDKTGKKSLLYHINMKLCHENSKFMKQTVKQKMSKIEQLETRLYLILFISFT